MEYLLFHAVFWVGVVAHPAATITAATIMAHGLIPGDIVLLGHGRPLEVDIKEY